MLMYHLYHVACSSSHLVILDNDNDVAVVDNHKSSLEQIWIHLKVRIVASPYLFLVTPLPLHSPPLHCTPHSPPPSSHLLLPPLNPIEPNIGLLSP